MKKLKAVIGQKRATIAILQDRHTSTKDIKAKFNIGITKGILTTSK